MEMPYQGKVKRLTPGITRRPPQATTCIAGHKVDERRAAGGRVHAVVGLRDTEESAIEIADRIL
jgi:hypothetical protein